jgi:hypothetical protein
MSVLFCLLAAPLAAREVATIDRGHDASRSSPPWASHSRLRAYQGFTYLLYKNGCEKMCGMNDLVMLDSGKVVDAVFRSSARRYTGTSTSPRMIPASAARRGTGGGTPLVVPPPPSAPLRKPTS